MIIAIDSSALRGFPVFSSSYLVRVTWDVECTVASSPLPPAPRHHLKRTKSTFHRALPGLT